jgi:hypothetical protein
MPTMPRHQSPPIAVQDLRDISIPRALVAGFGALNYRCEDQLTVWPLPRGRRRSHPSLNGEFLEGLHDSQKVRCIFCMTVQVRLDFMTDDLNEAEEMLWAHLWSAQFVFGSRCRKPL